MAISRVGLEQIVLCDKNTLNAVLPATPQNPIAAGIRMGATLEESQYAPVTDYLSRTWNNKHNFRVEVESLQPSMYVIDKSLQWLNGEVDVQLIPRKQSRTDTQSEVYKFCSTTGYAGLDIELVVSNEKRSIKHTIERALEYEKAKSIITDSGTKVNFTGITNAGEDQTLLRKPYLMSFEAPSGTALYSDKSEIGSYNMTMTTKNRKQVETNMSIVDFVTFNLTIEILNASFAQRLAMMNKDNAPSIKLKQQNSSSTLYDMFDFAAGALTLQPGFRIADDNRTLIYTFVGDVFVNNIEFLFGASNGGDVSDTLGKVGGTMKIGY